MFFQAGSRLRRLAFLGVLLHALVLTTAPFEHHDLVCHLKTPQHCTSCISSPLSSHPHTPVAPGACSLADAGQAVSVPLPPKSVLLSGPTTGRSPPRFV